MASNSRYGSYQQPQQRYQTTSVPLTQPEAASESMAPSVQPGQLPPGEGVSAYQPPGTATPKYSGIPTKSGYANLNAGKITGGYTSPGQKQGLSGAAIQRNTPSVTNPNVYASQPVAPGAMPQSNLYTYGQYGPQSGYSYMPAGMRNGQYDAQMQARAEREAKYRALNDLQRTSATGQVKNPDDWKNMSENGPRPLTAQEQDSYMRSWLREHGYTNGSSAPSAQEQDATTKEWLNEHGYMKGETAPSAEEQDANSKEWLKQHGYM